MRGLWQASIRKGLLRESVLGTAKWPGEKPPASLTSSAFGEEEAYLRQGILILLAKSRQENGFSRSPK